MFGRAPREARDEVGIVFQDPETQLIMARVGDDVAFGLENRCVTSERIWPRVHASLAAVGFPYPDEHRTDALSGGEKQRLAIAGVLALEPRVILMDEPTANLDPQGAADVRELVRALAADRTRTIVIVEHRVTEFASLVDRVIAIDAGGGVVADGAPDDVFTRDRGRLESLGVWLPGAPPQPEILPRTPGDVIASARGIAFRYPASSTQALDGVDVDVQAGEAVALAGPNGSGKSTLALIVAGLLRPDHGDARIGRDVAWKLPARRLVTRAGTVFQDPEHQFVTSRVDEELAIGPRRAGRSAQDAHDRAALLLERLGLAQLAAANPFTLSGGEQRRLSVATAIATSPPLLVLDEPSFGQDRRTYGELVALLARHRDDGGALLFASHDADLVSALADRTLAMRAGRVD